MPLPRIRQHAVVSIPAFANSLFVHAVHTLAAYDRPVTGEIEVQTAMMQALGDFMINMP